MNANRKIVHGRGQTSATDTGVSTDVSCVVLFRYGVASTYYGISLNISGFGLSIYLTHFIYAAIEVPAKLMIYCFLNIIGRRKCQAGTLLLTGLCIAINIFMPKGCSACLFLLFPKLLRHTLNKNPLSQDMEYSKYCTRKQVW